MVKNKKGFTLLEILVVIGVTSILFTIIAALTSSFISNYNTIIKANSINNETISTFSLFEKTINDANLTGKKVEIDMLSVKTKKYIYVFSDDELMFKIYCNDGESTYTLYNIENMIYSITSVDLFSIESNKGLKVSLTSELGNEDRMFNVMNLELKKVILISNFGNVDINIMESGIDLIGTGTITPLLGKKVDYWEENGIRIGISDGSLHHSFIFEDGLVVKVIFKEV